MTTEQETTLAARLGFQPGQVVLEIGHGKDVDQGLREEIEQTTGTTIVGEDCDEVADTIVLWFRDGNGDLTDALFDATANVNEGGAILLFTPKTGYDGYVDPSEIGGATTTAGLSQTKSFNAGKGWNASRLLIPTGARKR